jgi:sigma-E factor negative regulatory protein RseB
MKQLAYCANVFLLLGFSLQVNAGDDPQRWLERMGAAMSQMNYQGTFIYIAGDRMETMRITHVSDEHGSRERLSSVSGPRREVVRDQSGVKWISGDDEAVVTDPVVNWPMFLDQSLRGLSAQSGYYQLKLRDKKRIAERTGQRLDIIAQDSFRYGYSLWLESGSGLLLQWQLNDQNGETLAKLEFTELKIGSEVDRNELAREHSDTRQVASGLPVGAAKPISESSQWQAHWLPPGFRMTANRAPGKDPQGIFQHQVYSDGIASVSLYVEPLDAAAGAGLGLHEMGTSHIFSRKSNDVLITVVGDVPALTVEKIAESVSQKKP